VTKWWVFFSGVGINTGLILIWSRNLHKK